jgi:uncharacterized tellurite resistance protein B-like protein
MVAFLKKILGDLKPAESIIRQDSDTRIRVATCAILVEMANSDDDFTQEERDRIIEILQDRFELSPDEARELIEIAEEELKGSIDIFRFTNVIKENYAPEDRIRVLEEIWRIVYADGELSGREDTLVHKLSFLLGLTHKQLIDAKLKIKGK